jgi:hypothetical protein
MATCFNGFVQMEVAEDDKEKTAFIVFRCE